MMRASDRTTPHPGEPPYVTAARAYARHHAAEIRRHARILRHYRAALRRWEARRR